MSKSAVVVTQDPDTPVPREVLAQAIVRMSEAVSRLRKSGLNHKAIVVLVAHSSGQSQTAVRTVLEALESLRKDYCS